MKTEITDFAKAQLRGIFEHYAAEVSIETASKLISKIVDAMDDIERYPSLGVKEPLLEPLKRNHKFIVTGNYKIIFHNQKTSRISL